MIAAACALWSPASDGRTGYDLPEELPSRVARLWSEWNPAEPGESPQYFHFTTVSHGFGVRAIQLYYLTPARSATSLAVLSGWPLSTLSATTRIPDSILPRASWMNGVEVPASFHPASVAGQGRFAQFPTIRRPLPLRIEWSGAILGSLFWAAAMGLPLMVARYIRRYRRLIHAKCPACGYPLGATATCSECGERLAVRAVDVR